VINILDGVKQFKQYSLSVEFLEDALQNNEGCLAEHGQLWVNTGSFTGRAANDKYIVDDGEGNVAFGVAGKKISREQMLLLSLSVKSYLTGRSVYSTYFTAAGKTCLLVTENAWHCIFVKNMFVSCEQCDDVDLTIIDLPGCVAEPSVHGTVGQTFIACDFTSDKALVLICGTHYAGEIKKSVFSYVSYRSPAQSVLPMHSSVTTEFEGWNTTVFFGLSGTGKTTLSAYEGSRLLGDDEHLWSDEGITNIEAGCYAKAINLSREKEQLIWDASHRFLTVLENVWIDESRRLDFSNKTITENTRSAYPLNYIKDAHVPGTCVGHPKNIIMLTCDAFGVLPGVSRLDNASAVYQFISGYTAKVAGTEKGLTEPIPTFSPCFGGPFMPRPINVYASLFLDKLVKHKPDVWLVNTGWIGGGPNVGSRMDLTETRKIIDQIVSGKLKTCELQKNRYITLQVPVNSYNANPENAWKSITDYEFSMQKLIKSFQNNDLKLNLTEDILAVVKSGRLYDK